MKIIRRFYKININKHVQKLQHRIQIKYLYQYMNVNILFNITHQISDYLISNFTSMAYLFYFF